MEKPNKIDIYSKGVGEYSESKKEMSSNTEANKEGSESFTVIDGRSRQSRPNHRFDIVETIIREEQLSTLSNAQNRSMRRKLAREMGIPDVTLEKLGNSGGSGDLRESLKSLMEPHHNPGIPLSIQQIVRRKFPRPIVEFWKISEMIKKLKIKSPTVIDSEPDYQRKQAWTQALKQREYLNNLFGGCPSHPILLVWYKDENGRACYRLLDGKQRLTALRKFFEDKNMKIDIDDAIGNDWYGLSYEEMLADANCCDIFDEIEFQVSIYDTRHLNQVQSNNVIEELGSMLPINTSLHNTKIENPNSYATEEWIFRQVNSSVPLSVGEIHHAGTNDLNTLIAKIMSLFNSIESRIYTKTLKDNDRFKNEEIFKRVIYCIHNKDYFYHATPNEIGKFHNENLNIEKYFDNFSFIHSILTNHQNLIDNYWNIIETNKKGTIYKKTGDVRPISNVDLLTYGMMLLEMHPKSYVEDKFFKLVTLFYNYQNDFTNNKGNLSVSDLNLLEKYDSDSGKGTNSKGKGRKSFLDYLFTKI